MQPAPAETGPGEERFTRGRLGLRTCARHDGRCRRAGPADCQGQGDALGQRLPFQVPRAVRCSVSWMDSYMIALGRAKSAKAVAALVEKASALGPADDFSHFRAVSLALEAIGDKSAAPALARLLALDGVGGHAIVMSPLVPALPDNSMESGDRERGWCLRETRVGPSAFPSGRLREPRRACIAGLCRRSAWRVRRARQDGARKTVRKG